MFTKNNKDFIKLGLYDVNESEKLTAKVVIAAPMTWSAKRVQTHLLKIGTRFLDHTIM